MTREQVISIIEKEQLRNFNMDEERYNKENEVSICRENGFWKVYATDERASPIIGSEIVFDNESDAWENFLKRLRADKILNEM